MDINEIIPPHVEWNDDKIYCHIFSNFSEYFVEFMQ